MLTVHVVPHTHTDPGWLDTLTGYYSRDIKRILKNVMEALARDRNRTFVWSETCFFAMWWAEQGAKRRRLVRELVASGRLEFVGGGWVSHDEALPTPAAIVDQMAEGHAWLNATLGEAAAPRVGWQIDAFGHSAASASLMARMGLGALVINRINHKLKTRWKGQQHMEFRWDMTSPPRTRTSPAPPRRPALSQMGRRARARRARRGAWRPADARDAHSLRDAEGL